MTLPPTDQYVSELIDYIKKIDSVIDTKYDAETHLITIYLEISGPVGWSFKMTQLSEIHPSYFESITKIRAVHPTFVLIVCMDLDETKEL